MRLKMYEALESQFLGKKPPKMGRINFATTVRVEKDPMVAPNSVFRFTTSIGLMQTHPPNHSEADIKLAAMEELGHYFYSDVRDHLMEIYYELREADPTDPILERVDNLLKMLRGADSNELHRPDLTTR